MRRLLRQPAWCEPLPYLFQRVQSGTPRALSVGGVRQIVLDAAKALVPTHPEFAETRFAPHEHACIRCPMLSINPKMLPRLDELEADLVDVGAVAGQRRVTGGEQRMVGFPLGGHPRCPWMASWTPGAASCNVEVFRMGLGQEPPSSGDLDAYPATDAG